MLTNEQLELGSLISSKICHDLLAPVSGAILASSMLENTPPHEDLIQLITSSIENLSKKLQLFRLAFSFSKGNNTPLIKDGKNIALQAFTTEKHTLEWQESPLYTISQEGDWIRLILNLAMIAHESIPKGGTVNVDLTQIPEKISITSKSSIVVLHDDIYDTLNNQHTDLSLRTWPAMAIRKIIHDLDLILKIQLNQQELSFEIEKNS